MLGVNSIAPGWSGSGDLLNQRKVVEVRPERPDLPLSEVGHRRAGQPDTIAGGLQSRVLGEEEGAV